MPTLTLECAIETPGILYGGCYDAMHQHAYGAGSEFAVFRIDLAAELAHAAAEREQAQSQPAAKPDAAKPAEKPPPRTAEKLWTHHDSYVSSLVWRQGEVISAGYDRRLVWTQADSGAKVREIASAHDGWIRKLLPVGDDLLATAADDMRVKLWNAATGEAVRTLAGHAERTPQGFATALYALAVSADGALIAAADRVGAARVWEVASGKLAAQFRAPEFYTYDAAKRDRSIGGVRSLAFSADGKELVLGGIGQVSNVDGFVGPARLEVWEWAKPARIFVGQDKHNAVLNDLLAHPSGLLIGGGGGDGGGLLAAWDRKAEAATLKAKPKGHLQRLLQLADGTRLLALGYGGFQVWRVTAAE